jgi:hypothetical protein
MDTIGRGDFINGLLSLDGRDGDLGFEICALSLSLFAHLRLPVEQRVYHLSGWSQFRGAS